MKILHTADWHLGTFRSPVKDGVNLRTEDTKRCLDELIRVANEEKPDYSLVSGDIFHVGRLWSDRCCEEIITAIHYIRELAAVSKQVVVMRGTPNHDGSGQFNVLSEMFADVPNVHVVITPQVISFDDVDIAVLPGFDRGVFRANHPGLSSDEENVVFTNELSNIVTGLKAQCSPEKKSILMAHYTVPGCNTESGQTMMLTQFEPIIPQEALLAANYNLVALGHIHRPQKIMHRDWYYSGAINAMNFNDEGQQRGFWIHNWHELGTWQSIFHETPIREFATIELNDDDVTQINMQATGDDGTVVRQGATVATNTAPQAKLAAVSEFVITRESFNKVSIRVSAPITGAIYSVSINGVQYSFTSVSDDELSIIEGLSKAVNPDGYKVSVNESNITLDVISESASRSGILVLSDNLTTASVTTLADFATIDYGKLIFPNGTITIMITNISGFNAVENLIAPTYGRLQETDVELRHSYLAKSAIRSTRMIDSICSQLINNVPNVESATGYENNTDDTDEEGRPPHSVEIIVDGGDETSIASIILDKKAAGIQTFGSITVNVATEYGDSIPVSFNRPEYIYVWMKVTLDADKAYLPTNYANLAINSIVKDASKLQAGDNMLSQTFNDGIYSAVGGVTYVDIKCAATKDKERIPTSDEYTKVNINVESRQKIVVADTRIEVVYSGHS